jgi:AAA15 family ATPase/GTPase
MLKNLKVENFRMLQNFEIPRLGNVNLIVGKNNSGKSSVLEALRIYAKRAAPALLQEIAASHDEMMRPLTRNDEPGEDQDPLLFQDFFSGRKFPSSDIQSIYIGNKEKTEFVQIDHAFYIDEFEEIPNAESEIIRRRKRVILSKKTLLNEEELIGEQGLVVTVNETQANGWIELNDLASLTPRRSGAIFWERSAKEIPVSYVPTQFLSLDYLAQLWDSILFTPYAEDVKNTLKILDDNFEDIGFVKTSFEDSRTTINERHRINKLRMRSDRTAVIKLKASPASIPLNSMGDGMLRVLQLALTVFPAKGGILLIDEFENGLHWSVQEKIWDSLFKLASELKIQIFATTHSEDAVKAFSVIANKRTEEGVLIKLVKKSSIDGSVNTIGVIYDKETLQTATLTDTEIR